MLTKPLVLALFSILVASCSYSEPWFLTNYSPEALTLVVGSREYVLEGGVETKIRGLHYSGFSIRSNIHGSVSYLAAAQTILADWQTLQPSYVCSRRFGTAIFASINQEYELQIQPCALGVEPLILDPDAIPQRAWVSPNQSFQRTVKSVKPFAYAKAAPLFTAAELRR